MELSFVQRETRRKGREVFAAEIRTFVVRTRCHANAGFQRLQGLIDRANEISSGCKETARCTGKKEIEKARGRFSRNGLRRLFFDILVFSEFLRIGTIRFNIFN